MANQSPSDIHDSTTCALGPGGAPCEMCALVNESERRAMLSDTDPPTLTDADKAVLLDVVIQRARDDLNDGQPLTEMRRSGSRLNPVERRIAQAMERDKQFASFTVVRAAIADVLDAGDVALPPAGSHPHPWIFGVDEREEQTECRERFIDAVCTRIVELQSPPHNMDARLRAKTTTVESYQHECPKHGPYNCGVDDCRAVRVFPCMKCTRERSGEL
jgi:hypothetical protein